MKGKGPAKMFSPIFRQCPEIYQFSWDIDIDNRQRHYKKQQHKSRSFLLNKNFDFGFSMQHCYSVACFDFLWMAEKSDYPLRFLLSREPSLLFSLRGFFNFQTRIQWIIQFELTVDKLNEKERFFSVPKYLSEKLLYPFSRPGELEEPILSVVDFDKHERCISTNWKTAPFNFSYLKQEKYHLISKNHFICIGFEIHIFFHCLLFRNERLKKNWLFLQFSSLPPPSSSSSSSSSPSWKCLNVATAHCGRVAY